MAHKKHHVQLFKKLGKGIAKIETAGVFAALLPFRHAMKHALQEAGYEAPKNHYDLVMAFAKDILFKENPKAVAIINKFSKEQHLESFEAFQILKAVNPLYKYTGMDHAEDPTPSDSSSAATGSGSQILAKGASGDWVGMIVSAVTQLFTHLKKKKDSGQKLSKTEETMLSLGEQGQESMQQQETAAINSSIGEFVNEHKVELMVAVVIIVLFFFSRKK